MFAAKPAQFFVAKLSVGRDCGSLFLLSPANQNDGHTFEPIGSVAARLVDKLREKAGTDSMEVRRASAGSGARGLEAIARAGEQRDFICPPLVHHRRVREPGLSPRSRLPLGRRSG